MSKEQRERKGVTVESGFSPIWDNIAATVGVVTAAVYGAVWRHCQLRDGVCRASTRRIAGLLGMDNVTVQRHLRKLVDDGLLHDTTPGLRNRPHVYKLPSSSRSEMVVEALQQRAKAKDNKQPVVAARQPVQKQAVAPPAKTPSQIRLLDRNGRLRRGHAEYRSGTFVYVEDDPVDDDAPDDGPKPR